MAALAPDGLRTPWLIAGAMDTATFAWYITEQFAPTLRPGQVVALGNLCAHKAASIRPVRKRGALPAALLPGLHAR